MLKGHWLISVAGPWLHFREGHQWSRNLLLHIIPMGLEGKLRGWSSRKIFGVCAQTCTKNFEGKRWVYTPSQKALEGGWGLFNKSRSRECGGKTSALPSQAGTVQGFEVRSSLNRPWEENMENWDPPSRCACVAGEKHRPAVSSSFRAAVQSFPE